MKQELSSTSRAFARRQSGVTLIELMVGLLVGMLAVLIISEVMLSAEGQKRTATGGADAQVNGALAMYAMQRDVEQAGYGMTSIPNIFGCPLNARFNGATPAGFPTNLNPVEITTRAASLGGDSIRILASSADTFAAATRVMPIYNAGDSVFNVRSTVGFREGDLALVAGQNPLTPCWVFQVNGAPTATTLPRVTSGNWNAAGTPAGTYTDGDLMMNLGRLVDHRYEVNNGILQLIRFNAAAPNTPIVTDVQPDIVLMRAFYGRDTSGAAVTDGIVDTFDATTPAVNQWHSLLSVRLIAVARSSTYEKEIVTSTNPMWSVGATPPVAGAQTCPAGSCIELDVGAAVAGDVPAKHYRYKVFETVVPIRNILWQRSAP